MKARSTKRSWPLKYVDVCEQTGLNVLPRLERLLPFRDYRCPLRQPQSRYGLSLLEVLVALTIFLTAFAAIGQLVSNGVRGALRSRFQLEASILCESKLAEVVAGVIPLQSAQGVFPEDENWSWTLTVAAGPVNGLLRADCTVKRQSGNANAAVEFKLVRYVRDPQIYYAAQQEAEQNAAESGDSL